jgi:hypothetical protein
MNFQIYINAVKSKLNNSLIINSFKIVDERTLFNRGYFRARLTLKNGDFLEIAESFTLIDHRLITLSYRYQWMDSSEHNTGLWLVGWLTAGLTAFYMFRMYFLTFEGEFRGENKTIQKQLLKDTGLDKLMLC